MCPEDIDQHIGRDQLIGIVVHHLQDLGHGRGRKAHAKADIEEGIEFLLVLFPIDVHQQQQAVKLDDAFPLGLQGDGLGPFPKQPLKGFPVHPQLGGHFKEKPIFRRLNGMVHLCKGYHL